MIAAIRTRALAIAAGAALATVVAGVGWAVLAPASGSPAPASRPTPTATPDPLYAGGLQDPVAAAAPVVAPGTTAVRVDIPKIGVSSALEGLSIDAAGELITTEDYTVAGWYSGGVVPGAVGPAIIAGHVDSRIGPAIFERLDELAIGDQAMVTLSDGQVLTFQIYDSTTSPRAAFPTDEVYGNVPRPELRLITCGGPFDFRTRHYTANLILYAALVS